MSISVKRWEETGLFFENLPRRRKTNKIILHHTKAENPAEDVFDTLTKARQSVHFFIDNTGLIYQFCDADSVCQHAAQSESPGPPTSGNNFTIGIEVQNLASKTPNPLNRPIYTETINGKTLTTSGFLPAQTNAVIELCRILCREYAIPLTVPNVDGEVISRILTIPEWEAFSGIVGHFHLAVERRRDPGLQILEDILNA